MRLTRVDNLLDLRFGRLAALDGLFRENRLVGRVWRQDARHRRGFDERRRVRLRARNAHLARTVFRERAVADFADFGISRTVPGGIDYCSVRGLNGSIVATESTIDATNSSAARFSSQSGLTSISFDSLRASGSVMQRFRLPQS